MEICGFISVYQQKYYQLLVKAKLTGSRIPRFLCQTLCQSFSMLMLLPPLDGDAILSQMHGDGKHRDLDGERNSNTIY